MLSATCAEIQENHFMKQFYALTYTLLILFAVSSCGKADVTGIFIPEDKQQIKSIEFRDGKARLSYSFLDFTQGFIECRSGWNRIYLDDPLKGEIAFRIINQDTLECEHPSLAGIYKKGR